MTQEYYYFFQMLRSLQKINNHTVASYMSRNIRTSAYMVTCIRYT